jgi:hypothetical protein
MLTARPAFLLCAFVTAACSPDAASLLSQSQAHAAESRTVAAARRACAHLKSDGHMEVGISDYEACLGKRSNMTRPANHELCTLAKSTMSADGVCILSE